MKVPTDLFHALPPPSRQDWERLVAHEIEGDAEQLSWFSESGLALKALYTSEDIRPTAPLTASASWDIRDTVDAASIDEFRAEEERLVQAGVDEVIVRMTQAPAAGDARRLLETHGVHSRALHLEAGAAASEHLGLLVEAVGTNGGGVAGSIDVDPLGDLAVAGRSPLPIEAMFDVAAAAVRGGIRLGPDFRPLTIRGWLYGEAGATASQQLACVLAHATEYFDHLTDRGLAAGDIATSLTVSMTASPELLIEIAKLRAMRLLWARLMELFHVSGDGARLQLDVWGARHCQTRPDVHTNAVRLTTAAIAAVLGGGNSLYLDSFDALLMRPTEVGRRLARNTQLVLRHEAHLDRVADACGGAYFMEALTGALARRAWESFQQIEAQGGYVACLRQGQIQREIEAEAATRGHAVDRGERIVIGVNLYPDTEVKTFAGDGQAVDYTRAGRLASSIGAGDSVLRVQPLRLERPSRAKEEQLCGSPLPAAKK